MSNPEVKTNSTRQNTLTRRGFCKGMALASAAASVIPARASAEVPAKPEIGRKVKMGIVGLGHRGTFVGDFCQAHGGYEIVAVADYFEDVVNKKGAHFGVSEDKRFSGLSGYKRVLDSGIEALFIEDVPYFYPEQATAAVEAGCHVYVAKPFAVDVPGVLAMQAAAKKGHVFLVDYQLPTDAANHEVAARIREGGLGKVAHIYSGGTGGPWADPEPGPTIENLLQKGWLSHICLGGDDIVSYDIHIVDGVLWALEKSPASACGVSSVVRQRLGDSTDCGGAVFQFDDGTIWTHITQALSNNPTLLNLSADIMGEIATARVAYWGKVYVRGGEKHYSGSASGSIYNDGAQANVAEFYRCVTEGDCSNPTADRAVEGTLTAILGREAMAGKTYLTRDDVLRENKKLEADLSGLKA